MSKEMIELTDAEKELMQELAGITGSGESAISLVNQVAATYTTRPRYEVIKMALERMQHQTALLREKGLRNG